MAPWNEKQFKYEELFNQLQTMPQTEENTEIGKVLLVLIAICKDTEKLPEGESGVFFATISKEFSEMEEMVDNHFKAMNINIIDKL